MAETTKLTKEQKELNELKVEHDIVLKRCEIAEKRVESLVAFSKATLETNADFLKQMDGALKSTNKLHNMAAQNLGQLIKVLEQEKNV
jgi:ABC-type taurine transport system substrate-binding protein